MTSLITIEARPTFRDLHGRYTAATEDLLETRRDELRLMGRRVVAAMQREAPKRTGDFARGIRFRTAVAGDVVSLTTSSPQPLGRFIVQGTRPHIITPRGPGYPLSFVVNGERVFAYVVQHPGTAPDDFPGRALDSLRPEFTAVLRRISNRWILKAGGR